MLQQSVNSSKKSKNQKGERRVAKGKITKSSTAEYFAKNLQQVGFSSPTKAVLTTLKEAVDNSLDACEEAGILPELTVEVTKLGKGSSRSADLIDIKVLDNGPGLEAEDLPKVYGEYLQSSKFGRGRCTRGQQGIGISAATTWAQLTHAKGVKVISKTNRMRKAIGGMVDVDIKGNKGVLKNKETIDWDRPHGVSVEFRIDGRVQMRGDGGLLTYLEGTALLNPHLTLKYKLMDEDWVEIPRVSEDIPKIPPAANPHPHTLKLGEFITHMKLFGNITLDKFLKSSFSRINDNVLKDFTKNGLTKSWYKTSLNKLSQDQVRKVFQVIQDTELAAPTTRSVLTVGEEALSKSIQRLGEVDFFSVVTRRPRIADFKPVVVEVALARFTDRGEESDSVRVLRFANRVPLQFDKAACAITRSIESVNWKSYGLAQSKNSVPLGPYVFAVSVVSPFIKFKNASKETIDAADELVEEIRRALMQAGQKLSRHIRRENREAELERKKQHIEKFGPILVEVLARMSGASAARKKKAQEGLRNILGRDADDAEEALAEAKEKLAALKKKEADRGIQLKTKKSAETAEGAEETAAAESKTKKKTTKKTAGKKAPTKKPTKKPIKMTIQKAPKKAKKKVAKKTKAPKKAKKTAKKKTVAKKKKSASKVTKKKTTKKSTGKKKRK